MQKHILEIGYLIASFAFIVGLKMMNKPDSARKGNLVAAFGMALAVILTIFLGGENNGIVDNIGLIFAALTVGTVIGTITAKKVKMTSMPEMVSLFNGMGGACAMLISIIEFNHIANANTLTADYFSTIPKGELLTIFAGLIIGAVSFAGSIVAWGKLNGRVADRKLPAQQIINIGFLIIIIGLAAFTVIAAPEQTQTYFYALLILGSLYGILFVLPIGGADMPVVISLLNSFTGVAAACGGFLYSNNVMLMGGILVGSAGTILTVVMCKAMNRSLTNVLIGAVGGSNAVAGSTNSSGGNVRPIQATDVAIMSKYAQKVVIVPGYGLAVAQAQHICHELEDLLEKEGVIVKYAIHPVAGRMPGHMNVLLAESNVSYDKLIEMDHINPEFATTDVVLVVGANDVVNPAAKTDPSSPIYGMPILDVDNAKQVIVLKRSMKSGYAGIENELFFHPKTAMLFGDAKESLQKIVNEIKLV